MEHDKKAFLDILGKSMGIVKLACDKASIGRTTYYRWLKEDEEFKKAADQVQDEMLDFAESKLLELIQGVKVQKKEVIDGEMKEVSYKRPPCRTSVIFYLKTKGKKRGYIERTEIDNIPAGRTIMDTPDEEPAEE